MSIKQQKLDKLWQTAQSAFNSSNYKAAISALQKIQRSNAGLSRQGLYLLAECRFQLLDFSKAWALLENLTAKYTNLTPIELNLKGRTSFKLGDSALASEYFVQATQAGNDSYADASRIAAAELFNKLGDFQRSVDVLLPLLSKSDFYLHTCNLLIEAYSKQGHKQDAHALVEQLTQRYLLEGSIEQALHAALMLIDAGYYEQARKLLEKSKHEPNILNEVAEVLLLAHNGEYQKCVTKYEAIRSGDHKAINYDLARVYDKLGNYEESFQLVQRAAQLHLKERTLTPLNRQAVKKLLTKVLDRRESGEKDNTESPVFMGGFPRSGTTLLETALDTQKQLYIFSEADTMAPVIAAMYSQYGYTYPQDLAKLDDEKIDFLRGVYLSYAKRYFNNDDVKLGQIVDKSPYHTIALPLILTLFPNARVITPIRHPFDVLLSCFKQNFSSHAFNDLLLTLDSATELYKTTFEMWLYFKERVGENFLEIKYEDIVQDFDNQMQQVFDFIGIEADDSYKEFDKFAREKKHVTSASKGQVTQKLYKGSINTWHNYADKLLPYAPQLESIAAHYGYSLSFDDK
ncbi:tetratricopeptide repeat-containing sulfotransferase family protein [Pseudoalteromonas ruthenica]|uniref:Sulfotransferase family protein n=1 Tax=Pseudoalteromonas ruthenica TaxID=151081 RepID=A0A0F4PUF6_9GAMM|nr:sulfotransferase [Pseudoalteromonas ruthenica]KJY94992.1 hypothetical protein TW76_16150 [Pseudoalteromonas ruthenica]KJY98673.1 hypothetical protein TW72_13195 [Pseudoalteromonas ruthenica]TMO86965.1 hypothetical protein CWC12_11975 [Pseudoalteromonas ruthenica]TMO93775.1 hypothetical protein CWC13_05835 [Pseudoalteromonas ruthenica]TMO97475.1 hypothetical protein CWC07_13410 [Pseudoalteromonas ruthenica]